MKNLRIWIGVGVIVALVVYLMRKQSPSSPSLPARSGGTGDTGPLGFLSSLFGTKPATAAGAKPDNTASLISAGGGALTSLFGGVKSLNDVFSSSTSTRNAASDYYDINKGQPTFNNTDPGLGSDGFDEQNWDSPPPPLDSGLNENFDISGFTNAWGWA